MRGKYLSVTLFFIVLLYLVGCAGLETTDEEDLNLAEDLVQITQQQFEAENMEIGELVLIPFEATITCNGYIMAPPKGMAHINSQISGIVESIYCQMGDYVKKGQVLCRLSSTELIVLQQDFAESSANLQRLEADYERSKALYEEKIGAEKDFKAVESSYLISKAKYQSLKLRLELLDLDVSRIASGELYATFPIMAPINGYITNQNVVLGQFVELQKNLIEIVDVKQLRLQLSVFETDMKSIEPGQRIQFKSIGESETFHTATLSSIGKSINPESKTITCIAQIDNTSNSKFINNTYIEARISVDQTEANALPSEAILKSGKDYYVLVLKKSETQNYYLQKLEVKVGRVANGYTEIINSEGITKVVTRGVYNLLQE